MHRALPVLALCLFARAASASPKYELVKATEYGKAFVAQRGDARSLASALRLTLADLTAYLGTAPTSYRAYSDSRDANSGGATFLANAGQVPLKGLVTCKVGPRSTRVAVVLVRADAPPGEVGHLLNPGAPAAAEAGGGGKAIAEGHAVLRTYSFPDGTGTIGLADGWSTSAQTCSRMVELQGPDGEGVIIGASFGVATPQARFRAPGALVADFATPAQVLEAVGPQFSQMSQQRGGPAQQLDSIVPLGEQKPFSPRGKLAVLRWGIAVQGRGHYQVMGQVGLTPISPTSFMLGLTTARAPDAIFDRDLPVMLQMINSLRMNEARLRERGNQQAAAQKRWFQNQQAAHKAQVAAFDAHNKQWEANEKAFDQRNQRLADSQLDQSRRNDNFDELIRGYRTVEDTEIGVKTSVDLGNVDKIVDDLNERDPGRYREIPLRDELDPLQGR